MSDVIASAKPARARTASRTDMRVDHQPAFVLHATPWRETSLIVEMLTRDFGRLAAVARGAKRPTSQFRGLLAPFAPVAVSWSGRGDIKTLIRAEWLGGLAPLRGDDLLAAFYMNELLVRLLARADPHDVLFVSYARALHALASGQQGVDATLRSFELDLLRECGWLPLMSTTVGGVAIDSETRYRVDPERGCVPANGVADDDLAKRGLAKDDLIVPGAALHALDARDWADTRLAGECKRLLRALIAVHLGGRPLNTRRIFHDLRAL